MKSSPWVRFLCTVMYLISQNHVDVWAFVRKTCVIWVVALYFLRFSIEPTVGVEYDLFLSLRIQIFEYSCETFAGMP